LDRTDGAGNNYQGRLDDLILSLQGVNKINCRDRWHNWVHCQGSHGAAGRRSATPDQEITNRNACADRLKIQLKAIQKRIEELKSNK
jgi:hypothetical protein